MGPLSLSAAARESQSPTTNSPRAATKTQWGQKEKEKNRICKEPWISKGQITPYRTYTKACIGISWMENLIADTHMERHTLLVTREWKWEPRWALISYYIILYYIILYYQGWYGHAEPSFHLASSPSGSKMSAPAGGKGGRPEEVKCHPFRQDQEAVAIASIRSPPTRTCFWRVPSCKGCWEMCSLRPFSQP